MDFKPLRLGTAALRALGERHPCDAQWCGIYDRTDQRTPQESARRQYLATGQIEA